MNYKEFSAAQWRNFTADEWSTMTTLPSANGNPPTIKVKKLVPEAVIPTKATEGDSGFDLTAVADPEITETYVQYRTGISVELPPGYDIEIRARSSISKYDLVLANGVGTVDNGYRGELLVRFKVISRYEGVLGVRFLADPILYKKGDKIAQMVIGRVYDLKLEEVETLSDSERGTGGFGSTTKG